MPNFNSQTERLAIHSRSGCDAAKEPSGERLRSWGRSCGFGLLSLALLCGACVRDVNVGGQVNSKSGDKNTSDSSATDTTSKSDGKLKTDCDSESQCPEPGSTGSNPSDGEQPNGSKPNGDSSLGSTSTKEQGPSTSTDPDANDNSNTAGNGGIETGPAPGCKVPVHRPCDASPQAGLAHALGIACRADGAPLALPTMQVEGTFTPESYVPDPSVLPAYFKAREGKRLVMLSTGRPNEVSFTPNALKARKECRELRPNNQEYVYNIACPSVEIEPKSPFQELPKPLRFQPVDPLGNTDCADDPSLIGQGDCSNSLSQLTEGRKCWSTLGESQCQLNGVYDPASIRISLVPPPGIRSLSFDFAFLSAEYPFTYRNPERYVSDAFVVWMESPWWTGNVVFDDQGQAMTIENRLATAKDATNLSNDCPAPCQDKRLHGFAMQGHGGTPWLRTTVPVQPGKTLGLTFTIFELGSPFLDSLVYLDNLRWGCDQLDRPVTLPRP